MQIFYQASDTAGGESPKQVDPYNMSPDELDKYLQQVGDEPEPIGETPETTDTEEPVITDTPEPTEEKQPELEPEKTEEVKVDEPLIDDKFISKYSKDEQDILLKYKDKPISEVVKALANANKLIGKKSEEVKRELFPSIEQPIAQDVPAIVFPKEQKQEEVEKLKEDIILKQVIGRKENLGLSEDFPMPTTLDLKSAEYKEWLKTVNYDYPADLEIFKSAISQEKQQLDKAYQQLNYYRENYKSENDKIIDDEIVVINQYFGKAGLDLKELGVEFTDDVIEKMLFVEKNGQKTLDPKMFNWINGEVPILKEGALAQKFMNTEGVSVLSKVKELALTQGRKEAVTVEKKLPINKGLGATTNSGEFKIEKAGATDPYTMNLERLDREIATLMNQE